MGSDHPHLAEIAFAGTVIEWRGPAPFLFVAVPVAAPINGAAFTTSLFPREGGYLLPIKVAVQKAANVGIGDGVQVWIAEMDSAVSRPGKRRPDG